MRLSDSVGFLSVLLSLNTPASRVRVECQPCVTTRIWKEASNSSSSVWTATCLSRRKRSPSPAHTLARTSPSTCLFMMMTQAHINPECSCGQVLSTVAYRAFSSRFNTLSFLRGGMKRNSQFVVLSHSSLPPETLLHASALRLVTSCATFAVQCVCPCLAPLWMPSMICNQHTFFPVQSHSFVTSLSRMPCIHHRIFCATRCMLICPC